MVVAASGCLLLFLLSQSFIVSLQTTTSVFEQSLLAVLQLAFPFKQVSHVDDWNLFHRQWQRLQIFTNVACWDDYFWGFFGQFLNTRVTLDIRDVTRCKPVLKGWTTKLLNARESREVLAGGFGLGRLDAPRQCSNIHDHQASPIGAGPPQLNSSIPITSHNPQQATITKVNKSLVCTGIFTKVAGNRGGRHQIGFVDARRREETELEVSLPPATPIYSLRPLPPTATGRLTAAGAGRLCCWRGRVVGNETEKERETNATSCCLASTAGDSPPPLPRLRLRSHIPTIAATPPPRQPTHRRSSRGMQFVDSEREAAGINDRRPRLKWN
nr:uncharacterized protein LOC109155364 [Ipomoea batatas]